MTLHAAVVLPLCLLSPVAFASDAGKGQTEVHLKFDGDSAEPKWTPQNDNVMGGELDGPPVNLSQVGELSFLISDKREGPFSLKVDWMKAE